MSKGNKLPQLVFLSTEIGRGHPNYLDSVFRLFEDERSDEDITFFNVFELSQGLSKSGWNLVKSLYFLGGKGGLSTNIYNFFRGKKQGLSKDSVLIKILGQDLKKHFEGFKGICLVDHPLTATILSDVCRVWYLHGEIAAPAECAVKGVDKIFVPLKETGDSLISFGIDPKTLFITGISTEPELVEDAEDIFNQRVKRIQSEKDLTIGFFISGAYPPNHIEKIILGAESVIKNGMRAIVFLGYDGKRYKRFEKEVKKLDVKCVEDDSIEKKEWRLLLVKGEDRISDTKRATELLPYLDAFVAAPHERTNWAIGLGLPLFALFPLIGTFAPGNFEFAQKNKVVYPLKTEDDARKLGQTILRLEDEGILLEMAKNGFGKYEIDGAKKVSTLLLDSCKGL